jgi:hypothetical protein
MVNLIILPVNQNPIEQHHLIDPASEKRRNHQRKSNITFGVAEKYAQERRRETGVIANCRLSVERK